MTVISMPSRSDFDAVFDKPDAKSSTRDFLVLAKLTSGISSHRIGFVTSRKKSAALSTETVLGASLESTFDLNTMLQTAT